MSAGAPPQGVPEEMKSIFVSVRSADVVIVKGLIEAHEGVGQVYAERGGELELSAPASQFAELCAIVDSLDREFGILLRPARTSKDGS